MSETLGRLLPQGGGIMTVTGTLFWYLVLSYIALRNTRHTASCACMIRQAILLSAAYSSLTVILR